MVKKNTSNTKSSPKVSIVILNYDGLKDTIECLESLKKITYPNYGVIVVDNNSKGNDADVLEKRYKNYIKLLRNKENLGFSGGNNAGIRKAIEGKSDFVLLLNNDTVVEENFLTELAKVASRDEKITIIGSIIADYYNKKVIFTNSKIDRKLKMKSRIDYLKSDKERWETDGVQGSSMMIRTKDILEHSLFLDEKLFLYCEEVDICTRTKEAGLKIKIAGKSIVYHKEGKSYGGGIKPLPVYYILRNRIFLSKKLLNTREQFVFWILFTSSRLVRILQWFFTGKWFLVKISFRALKDGILGKMGKSSINF